MGRNESANSAARIKGGLAFIAQEEPVGRHMENAWRGHRLERLLPCLCPCVDFDWCIVADGFGNFNEVVPELIEIGWDCLQPLEVKAGMDVIQLKREYGDKIALMGGIDVRVMADGTDEELEDEIGKKITIAKENGGYIYHSDHSVPDNVSFPRYRRVIELVHQYGSYA